jgi:hypothetical protein
MPDSEPTPLVDGADKIKMVCLTHDQEIVQDSGGLLSCPTCGPIGENPLAMVRGSLTLYEIKPPKRRGFA